MEFVDEFTDASIFENETQTILPAVEVSKPVERILRDLFRSYEPYCWRSSYGRGAGRLFDSCPDDSPERDGLLCYPNCTEGYNGVGPVCWEKCSNISSFGFLCLDFQSSIRSCPWYDKCGVFRRSCSICPDNYYHFGCFCGRFQLRQSYGRGVGTSMICSNDLEQVAGLCYDKCRNKYNGVGPVCWQQCPMNQPIPCFAGCAATNKDCQMAVINMIQSVISASIAVLNVVIGLPLVTLKTIDISANAAKGDWILVAQDVSILAAKLAQKVLPNLAKKFFNWPSDKLESATNNATLLITTTALKDRKSLLPILKFFRLDAVNSAFNHGKCDFPDDIDSFFD